MGREIKNNPQEALLTFAMCAIIILGVIGGAGSLNWGAVGDKGILYIIAGLVAIVNSIIAGLAFYKRFLKPE